MVKVVRQSQGSIIKFKCFCWPKSIFHHYYIQDIKDGIRIRVYRVNKERVTPFRQLVYFNKS